MGMILAPQRQCRSQACAPVRGVEAPEDGGQQGSHREGGRSGGGGGHDVLLGGGIAGVQQEL